MNKFSLGVLVAALLLTVFVFMPRPALSETTCPRGFGTSETAFTQLQNQYQEVNEAFLVSEGGSVFFLFVNPLSKTWTMLQVRPDGCARAVAVGTGYEFSLGEPEGEPS